MIFIFAVFCIHIILIPHFSWDTVQFSFLSLYCCCLLPSWMLTEISLLTPPTPQRQQLLSYYCCNDQNNSKCQPAIDALTDIVVEFWIKHHIPIQLSRPLLGIEPPPQDTRVSWGRICYVDKSIEKSRTLENACNFRVSRILQVRTVF